MDLPASICVMPAAGASSRMGSWKPLAPFGSSTVARNSVDAALDAGLRVVLVTGYRAAELEAAFAGVDGVTCVRNDGWEGGMLGSIQAALRAVGTVPFFTAPADLPCLSPLAYRAVADAVRGRGRAGLPDAPVIPRYRDVPGHPVFVPAALVPAILDLPPGERLKPFLETSGAAYVALDEPGSVLDVDDEESYGRALAFERARRSGTR